MLGLEGVFRKFLKDYFIRNERERDREIGFVFG